MFFPACFSMFLHNSTISFPPQPKKSGPIGSLKVKCLCHVLFISQEDLKKLVTNQVEYNRSLESEDGSLRMDRLG